MPERQKPYFLALRLLCTAKTGDKVFNRGTVYISNVLEWVKGVYSDQCKIEPCRAGKRGTGFASAGTEGWGNTKYGGDTFGAARGLRAEGRAC